MGFKALGRTNRHGQGVKKIWNVTEQSPQLRGAMVKRWNSSHPLLEEPKEVIDLTTIDYSTQLKQNKILVNVPESIFFNNRLTGVEELQTFSYDAYFTPNRVLTEYFSGEKLQASTDETLDYLNNPSGTGNDYYVGRLDKRVVTQQRGEATQSITTDYISYAKHQPTEIEQYASADEKLTLKNSYDAFGNRTGQGRSAAGLEEQSESRSFSPDGRLLTASTGFDGLTTTYTHHKSGTIATRSSPLGRSTAFGYDSFGRTTSATDFLGH